MREYVFYHISQSIVRAFNVLLEFAKICSAIGIKKHLWGLTHFKNILKKGNLEKLSPISNFCVGKDYLKI